MSAYRIFIIEDDVNIATQIAAGLNGWGFACDCVRDFSDVEKEVSAFAPHLILLDIMLPFYNGYHWCGQIRKSSNVPIIFLSSASDNMNIVMAMNMGGDDFIAKPFDLTVLVAKVQALLRRAYNYTESSHIEHRGFTLNLEESTLSYPDGKLELTKNEYRILRTLLEQKGKIVSRERLMQKLWETDSFIDDNTLTVNINRLRKKLDGCGAEGFITTRHGQGYLIEE